FDDFGGTGGERIDLSLAQILARQKNMLVKRHARVPFTSMPIAGDPPEWRGPSGFLGVSAGLGPQRKARTYRFRARKQGGDRALTPPFARRERSGAYGGTIPDRADSRRVDIAGWLFDEMPFLTALVESEWLLGLAFLTLTATITAFGVPGVLVPISFSS